MVLSFRARRIKFKVFDLCHKKCHVVGEYHHDYMSCGGYEDLEVFYYNPQCGEGSITYDEKLPTNGSGFILMQYTGFNDCENKELYEYDIVSCDGAVGLIVFQSGCWFVLWEKEDGIQTVALCASIAKESVCFVENYFAKPELLKKIRITGGRHYEN